MATQHVQSGWCPKSPTTCSPAGPGTAGRCGFTLLECLIAVVVLVVILMMTLAILADASSVRTTAEITGELNMTARRCVDRIVRDTGRKILESDQGEEGEPN